MSDRSNSSIVDFSKKLKSRLQDIKDRVESMRGKRVVVGIPKSAKYPNGKSVAEVAEQIEYGICEIGAPMRAGPRPFIRVAIASNKGKWNRMLQDGVRKALRAKEKPNLRPLMEKLGERIKKDIQETMMSFPDPIYDTGKMHDSISVLKINNTVVKT